MQKKKKKKETKRSNKFFFSCIMNVCFMLLLTNMLVETFDGAFPKQLRNHKIFPLWGNKLFSYVM